VFTDFGTAVVIGGALSLAWRHRAMVGTLLTVATFAVLAWGNIGSVQGFTRSAADARAVLRDIRSLPRHPATPPVVIGPLPNHDGVAGFTSAYDITDALRVEYGASAPKARVTVTDAQAAALVGTDVVLRYCPSGRALIPWVQACVA
jgi:hypothetical protein